MKSNYFDEGRADDDDWRLRLAIVQRHVPAGCLLNGPLVWGEVAHGRDPCAGCYCPREKCGGRKPR